MIKNYFLLILITFSLFDCSVTPSSSPSIASAVLPTTTSLPIPSPTATLTLTPDPGFTRQCLKVETEEITLKDISSGIIYLDTLLDITTGEKHKLPVESTYSLSGDGHVSFDGNLLAYKEYVQNAQKEHIKDILWVVDAHAKISAKVTFNQIDLGYLKWLNQEHLIIDMRQTRKNGNMLVINPFTHKQEIISNELPGLDSRLLPLGPWWRVEYSPDLKRVVYYSSNGPVFRNVDTKQTLWISSVEGDWGTPAWSPDGQEVAISAGGQLYLLDYSGQPKAILAENQHNQEAAPVWAPDGMHIAFWNFDNLMLYDRQTEEIRDLCVKNNWATKPSVTWSPDGSQFWADGYVESDQNSYTHPVLVDLKKSVVYINILEMQNWSYGAPTIWMKSKP